MINTGAIELTNAGSTEKFTVVEVKLLVESLAPSDLYDLIGEDFLGLVDPTKGVIFNGKMPMWLAACLTHEFHAVSWLAMNDPRLGAVVIASHNPNVKVADIVDWRSELYIN